MMPLFLVTRPKGAEHLRNSATLHGAVVEAADGTAAIAAANALAIRHNAPFAGFDTTQFAATAEAGFVPALTRKVCQRRCGYTQERIERLPEP